MTITQPTEAPPAANLLAAAASAYQFLIEYPQFADLGAVLGIRYGGDGVVDASPRYRHPRTLEVIVALADALHAKVTRTGLMSIEGERLVGLYVYGECNGVPWRAVGYVDADPYEAFAVDHDPDPQAWPPAERTEYAAFAAHYAEAVTS